jgi:hypothetical protein
MIMLAILVGGFGLFGFGWMSYPLGSAHGLSVRVAPEQALIAMVSILGIALGMAVLTATCPAPRRRMKGW